MSNLYQFNNSSKQKGGNRHTCQYDYDWIDDLAGAVDVLTTSMSLPDFLVEELLSVSIHLSEIYIEACRWEGNLYNKW